VMRPIRRARPRCMTRRLPTCERWECRCCSDLRVSRFCQPKFKTRAVLLRTAARHGSAGLWPRRTPLGKNAIKTAEFPSERQANVWCFGVPRVSSCYRREQVVTWTMQAGGFATLLPGLPPPAPPLKTLARSSPVSWGWWVQGGRGRWHTACRAAFLLA
jgi:hypothetical protein